MTDKPLVFDDETEINIDAAPQINAEATAMGVITTRTARRTGWLGRVFIWAFTALIGLAVSIRFWDFVNNLLARNALLGQIAIALLALLGMIAVIYILRELRALMRLNRVDRLRQSVHDTRVAQSSDEARKLARQIHSFYGRRAPVKSGDFIRQIDEQLDAEAILEFTERALLAERDNDASREIEARARQVAVVTAFVPLALADIIAVLTANIGMIRRIAEIYGGRPGMVGGWRLFRKVAAHLVATGAVAVGDDVIGSVVGGSVVGRLSRRFGEGIINGALTARVGIAALEVCRPMAFDALPEPQVSKLIPRALAGFAKRTENKREHPK